MLWRRSFALFLALLALAAPASSFAQSAGQDQYQDPLAGGDGSSGSAGGGSTGGGSTGGGSTSGGSTGTVPSGTPSTTPAATTPGTTGTATASPTATGAQATGELPRTGFDVILTFEMGLAMLLLGLVSHRLIVLRDRRHS